MCSKGILKRFIPFFLTFAAGLLIASFFVPLTSPGFSFGGRRFKHRECDRQRDAELQRVREENYNLKLQIEEMQKNQVENDWQGTEQVLPLIHEIPPPPPPKAPPAPRVHR